MIGWETDGWLQTDRYYFCRCAFVRCDNGAVGARSGSCVKRGHGRGERRKCTLYCDEVAGILAPPRKKNTYNCGKINMA